MTTLNQAINQQNRLWFDLETTGLSANSEIWELAYAQGQMEPKSIFAKTVRPWEAGALAAQGVKVGYMPSRYNSAAKGTEEDLVRAFGDMITKNPHATLSGYNISRFDIPLMIKKFTQYGMEKELDTLKKMKVSDTYLKAQTFLDNILSEDARIALMGSAKGRNVWSGTKLGQMAEALGIDIKQFQTASGDKLHQADVDNKIARAIDDVLSNPAEAAKRYSVLSHAQIIDEYHKAFPKNTATGEKVVEFSRVKAVEKLQARGVSLTNPITDLDFSTPQIVRDLVDDFGVPIIDKEAKILATDSHPVIVTARQIKEEAKETAAKVADILKSKETQDKVVNAVRKAKKALVTPSTMNALKLGGIAAGAYLAYSFIKDKMHGSTDGYIDASVLGKGKDDLERAILKSPNLAAFNEHYKKQRAGEGFQLKSGKQIHKIVEEEFNRSDIGYTSEMEVVDHELGVKGNIDVVAKIDGHIIPIELKSISGSELRDLEEPKREHASQLNFYSHGVNADGGYVMYISTEDTSDRKTFYVPYSASTLIRDVADFRSAIIENRSKPGILGAWGAQMEEFFQDYEPSGEQMPSVDYDMNAQTSRSKIRDQASRNAHFTPVGTPRSIGNTSNGSHYNRSYE